MARRIVSFLKHATAGRAFYFVFVLVSPPALVKKISRVVLSTPFSRTAIFAVVGLLAPFGVLSSVLLQNTSPAEAAINEQLHFQARLLTAGGSLVPDGDYHVRFKIYCGGDGDTVGAGTGTDCLDAENEDLLWTETHTTGNLISVVNGYVAAQLNSINAWVELYEL